jgi:HlyD family secretion protein
MQERTITTRPLWPPLRHNRWLRIGVALAAALVLAFAVYQIIDRRPVTVRIAVPEEHVTVQVYGLATVEAQVLSEIGFEVGAALIEVLADHGEQVRKGQVLARLHSAEQEAKVVMAKAGVRNAEAALESARAALSRARATLEQRQAVDRRQQQLLRRGVTSAEAAEAAEKDRVVAETELAAAQAGIAVAEAQLADAKAKLEFEAVLLEHHELVAPFDGLVVHRHKEPGTVLRAGEPVFTIIDPQSVWAKAYVDEARAGDIRVGQTATVRLRSQPDRTYEARVTRIDIESDRVNEERIVYLKCERCPERMHLGEQAEVVITIATLEKALLVPEHAIRGFDGASGYVWTVDEDGRLHERKLSFGQRTLDGRVVVAAGDASAGFRPLVHRPERAKEGRAARISNGSEQ